MLMPFHLSMPVNDLDDTILFYTDILGCKIGRYTKEWCDISFFGHQLSLHLKPQETSKETHSVVEDVSVPTRHFGIVLEWDIWHDLQEKLEKSKVKFINKPFIRFKGKPGEQATMYFYDPSFNAIEFKSFRQFSELFKSFDKLKTAIDKPKFT